MKYRVQSTLYHLTIFLESVIGVFLVLGVVFSILGMGYTLDFVQLFYRPSEITHYLSIVATIVLSIEFTKMLCTHSLDSVVEVLSMAIAREIIAHETSAVQNLLGVIAIAILFTIRKYCFIPQLDRQERSHRSLARETLRDFIRSKEPEDTKAAESENEETFDRSAK